MFGSLKPESASFTVSTPVNGNTTSIISATASRRGLLIANIAIAEASRTSTTTRLAFIRIYPTALLLVFWRCCGYWMARSCGYRRHVVTLPLSDHSFEFGDGHPRSQRRVLSRPHAVRFAASTRTGPCRAVATEISQQVAPLRCCRRRRAGERTFQGRPCRETRLQCPHQSRFCPGAQYRRAN